MRSLFAERRSVNIKDLFAETLAKVQETVRELLTREIEQQMEAAIDELLGRGQYDRRESVPEWV